MNPLPHPRPHPSFHPGRIAVRPEFVFYSLSLVFLLFYHFFSHFLLPLLFIHC